MTKIKDKNYAQTRVILTGPQGCGKSTILDLIKQHPYFTVVEIKEKTNLITFTVKLKY